MGLPVDRDTNLLVRFDNNQTFLLASLSVTASDIERSGPDRLKTLTGDRSVAIKRLASDERPV